MEALLIPLLPIAIKILFDLGASATNEAIRRNKEAGVRSAQALVWAAFVLNFGAANVDKVTQLVREGGAPDGRAPRAGSLGIGRSAPPAPLP